MTLLLLLFDVDDSGSAMTVDVTKDVSEGWADTELDIIGPDVTDPGGDDDKDAGCHRLLDIVLSQPQVAASAATQISPGTHAMTFWNNSSFEKYVFSLLPF